MFFSPFTFFLVPFISYLISCRIRDPVLCIFGCLFSHLFIFISDLLHLHWTCNVVVLLLPAVTPRYVYRYGTGKGRREGSSIHGV